MAQDAFLKERDPGTYKKWKNRQGVAYGEGVRHVGDIEKYLAYRKLYRTGRLFKSLKAYSIGPFAILHSSAPYASVHQEGGNTALANITHPFVKNGASKVTTGGEVRARPFMTPSKAVLGEASRLMKQKLRKW